MTAGLTALLLPLAAAVGLAAPAEAATSATASYAKTSDWGNGFEGKWTVKNTGTTTLSSWKVEWDFPAGTTVTSSWDAVVTGSDNHWTAKDSGWNAILAPGASVSFGFNGTGTGAPSGCKVNGAPCDGSTQPGDAAPSAPGTPDATDITDTSVKLTWSAATDDHGIKDYEVLRGGAKVATVTGLTYSDTGLTAGTDYSYTVRARDTADQTGPAGGARTVRTTGGGSGPGTGTAVKLGYFAGWGVYGRNYHVKNLVTSGSAAKITHINYAFGNVKEGKCAIGDPWADYQKTYDADQSVDGVADTSDQPVQGNFNQLRKLKKAYPDLKVLWSFGGWTWSRGFGEAVQNPAAFAKSCHDLVEDPRWADVFDGIDLDWEYPNACADDYCDTSGPAAFKTMMQAVRSEFGTGSLVTAAVTADASADGKMDSSDYAGAAPYADWFNVMTYDFFGSWAGKEKGPTAPHSPLTAYEGIPQDGFDSAAAIAKYKTKGVPAGKLLLGIGSYGRGWTGVTQSAPGGSATGAAEGTFQKGIEDYKVLKGSCPSTGTVAGTAYAHCGTDWWGYDTPATITSKMTWAKDQSLGGAFFWEFSGDTTDGELLAAIDSGLKD
ncbi:glycosyl hydrolase family 18 protein [Streptomyces sp. NPDC056401]|uniref:glycosyl hydrolase family 18 protein n=1 Tax=Streptomyces sp. NPDC056401 TaxID=3345809 RepID=UPI0035DBB715